MLTSKSNYLLDSGNISVIQVLFLTFSLIRLKHVHQISKKLLSQSKKHYDNTMYLFKELNHRTIYLHTDAVVVVIILSFDSK